MINSKLVVRSFNVEFVANKPNAMSVRFATVLFQTGTSITSLGESASALAMWISVVLLVIFSIAHMKMSEIMEIPRKLKNYVFREEY